MKLKIDCLPDGHIREYNYIIYDISITKHQITITFENWTSPTNQQKFTPSEIGGRTN